MLTKKINLVRKLANGLKTEATAKPFAKFVEKEREPSSLLRKGRLL